MVAVAAESVGRGAADRRDGEADDAAVDRLERVVGRHGDGQRVGERLADHGRLRGAAVDGREVEALALEGADVEGPFPASGTPRWSVCRGLPGSVVPACRSPGCRGAGPWWGSARRSRPAAPAAGCRRSGCCCRCSCRRRRRRGCRRRSCWSAPASRASHESTRRTDQAAYAGTPAELPLTVQLVSAAVLSRLYSPPPSEVGWCCR